jgi:hypothetical protein
VIRSLRRHIEWVPRIKGALFALTIVVALVADVWLALFGTAQPCEAVAEQVPSVIADQSKEVVDETHVMLAKLSPLQCAGIALRLKVGDKSVLQLAALGK